MRTLIIFAVVVCFIPAFGQTKAIDSLNDLLNDHPDEDTTRVTLLNQLSLRIFKARPDLSITYAEQALALAKRLSFQKGIAEASNNLAVCQLVKGNDDMAMNLALNAVAIAESEGLPPLLADAYATLANVYHSQKSSDKAKYFINLAKAQNSRSQNVVTATKILNIEGGLYLDKKNYDSALLLFNKALDVMKKGNDDYRLADVINNIGRTYSRMNDQDRAMGFYQRALNEAEKSSNLRVQAFALSNMGNSYLADKNYKDANKALVRAITIARKIGDRKALSGSYMAMMQLQNEIGNFNEAHMYMAGYYQLKDSMLNAEKAKQIAELQIQYETAQKEHSIELLERDKRIQMLWKNILIAALVILSAASVAGYYIQRFRESANRQILNLEIERLTSQHNALSEKYKKNVLVPGDDVSVDSQDQRLLKKAIEVVEEFIADPSFSVEKMAREMGMSRTNMHRRIKAITGFPPSELIRSIRLRKAAQLLINQTDSVSQISFQVGFEDHSYFSKSFKKQFGVPPSEYFQTRGQLTV